MRNKKHGFIDKLVYNLSSPAYHNKEPIPSSKTADPVIQDSQEGENPNNRTHIYISTCDRCGLLEALCVGLNKDGESGTSGVTGTTPSRLGRHVFGEIVRYTPILKTVKDRKYVGRVPDCVYAWIGL